MPTRRPNRSSWNLSPLFVLSATFFLGCGDSPWQSAGSLDRARVFHSATLLANDKVLIAGGENAGPLASAELYDSLRGTWSAGGALMTSRGLHTATRMGDGRVIVSGGKSGDEVLTSVEIYDPRLNLFSPADSMVESRSGHTATWIQATDTILVAGGKSDVGPRASAETYEGATNVWSSAGSMTEPRQEHSATTLENGQILIAGGMGDTDSLSTVELYDPLTMAWSSASLMAEARKQHTATRLKNGKILVAGGNFEGRAISSAELYDPATNTWSSAARMVAPRYGHTAIRLDNTQVLVTGGVGETGALSSVEVYDPATNTWSFVDSMPERRDGHTATLLADGQVLVVGGGADKPIPSAELYVPPVAGLSCEVTEDCPASLICNEEKICEQLPGPLSSESACAVGRGGKPGVGGAAILFAWAIALASFRKRKRRRISIVSEGVHQVLRASLGLSAQGGLDFAASRHPELARSAGSNNGAPPQTPQNLKTPQAIIFHSKILINTLSSLFVSSLLLASSPANAQTPTFYLDRLQIAGAPDDGLAIWRPAFGPTRLFGQFALGYAKSPLRADTIVHDSNQAGALRGQPLAKQLTMYSTLGAEIIGRGAIQVTFPFVAYQQGYGTNNQAAGLDQAVLLSPQAPGDLRVDGRMLVVRSESGSFALAARMALFVPIGDETSFTGDIGTWGSVGLSAEYNAGFFFVTLNGGASLRPKSELHDLTVGTEGTYGLAVYVPLQSDRLRLGAELFGSFGLLPETMGSAQASPLEWSVNSRVFVDKKQRIFLGLGAGTRLTGGYAPDFRFVARIGGSLVLEDEVVERRIALAETQMDVDSDTDGIPDVEDICPDAREDHRGIDDGCPAPGDRDEDGISDTSDKCPDKPEDKDGIEDRDGCAEEDADRDGVLDASDKCPEKPEDKDGIDDGDGCGEDDADADNVLDIADKCPKEPGVHDADPAKNGCPEFIRMVGREVKLVKQIEFEFDKGAISANSYPILDEIAKLLVANPDIKLVKIEGYTDNVGTAEYNERLSHSRASAVRDYLVKRGKIDPIRLTFKGFGPKNPLTTNDTLEGRARNRRVEFHIAK